MEHWNIVVSFSPPICFRLSNLSLFKPFRLSTAHAFPLCNRIEAVMPLSFHFLLPLCSCFKWSSPILILTGKIFFSKYLSLLAHQKTSSKAKETHFSFPAPFQGRASFLLSVPTLKMTTAQKERDVVKFHKKTREDQKGKTNEDRLRPG